MISEVHFHQLVMSVWHWARVWGFMAAVHGSEGDKGPGPETGCLRPRGRGGTSFTLKSLPLLVHPTRSPSYIPPSYSLKNSNWQAHLGIGQKHHNMLEFPKGRGFPHSSVSKETACNAGHLGSIPGSGRYSGVGNGNPLQYSRLENPIDRGAWQATVHGIARVNTT